MANARETLEFDERGFLQRGDEGGNQSLVGRIKTLRGSFEQFAPFDQAERDLVRVATAVMHADRQCPRGLPGHSPWEKKEANRLRQLNLRLPLENPERWNSALPLLVKLLRFMTDDLWSFEFVQAEFRPKEQLSLFPKPVSSETELALFSGGLDSVVGLKVRHDARPRPFLAVTVYGDNAKLAKRKLALHALRDLGVPVELLEFYQSLHCAPYRQCSRPFGPDLQERDPPVPSSHDDRHPAPPRTSREEKSQRTRGFLFFSVAAAMASAIKLTAVASYEAGVGALNVPTNEAQIGAQNTRAMHPWTLLQMEKLFHTVLERPIRLEAPFLLETKGEVCRRAAHVLECLARVAMSCDETEARKAELEHCGICTSCLLRRVALFTAIGDRDPTVYRDIATRTHGRYDVQSFATQALRFQEACGAFNALLHLDPDIRHALLYHVDRGLSRREAEKRICELFARQADEAQRYIGSPRFPGSTLAHAITEAL